MAQWFGKLTSTEIAKTEKIRHIQHRMQQYHRENDAVMENAVIPQ